MLNKLEEEKMLQQALKYRENGLSVFPVDQEKVPLIKWRACQTEIPTEEEVRKWWSDFPDANIGVATGTVSNLAVIDVDTDEGKEIVKEYIPEELVTPQLTTPKGGKHYWFSCNDPKLVNNTRSLPGIDFRANGGYVVVPPSQNGNGRKYEWDIPWDTVTRVPVPDKYLEHLSNMSKSNIDIKDIKNLNSFDLSEGKRNEVLFHLAYTTLRGGAAYAFARGMVHKIGLESGLPASEIDKIFNSAYQRAVRGERNIAQEIRDWVKLVTSCDFSVTEVYKDLDIVTKEDKAATRKALTRLSEDKVIVPNGKGRYRTVSEELEYIDIFGAEEPEFKLTLPLDIHKWYKAQAGNIIVVSGEKNTGKTAFCLSTMRLNHEHHKIRYMSSEMSEGEFKMRIRKFDEDINSWKWKNIELLNRTENFSDLITDDGRIYIIDFMEIYDDFYKVGAMIRDIWKALNHKGLAIVCLQKNKGSVYGRGGSFSVEKARLVLNLEATFDTNGNICKMVNVKNWQDDLTKSPDGQICRYKLVNGNKFSYAGDENAYWHHPEPECSASKPKVKVVCG